VAVVALVTAYLFSKDTLPWARAEATVYEKGTYKGPLPRFPDNVSEHPSSMEIFTLVSFRHRTFSALSQAGCVEKFVDALVWAFSPIYFIKQGLTVIEIVWIVGIYVIGALFIGLIAEMTGNIEASFMFTAGAIVLSGL
jgi:hypothetical protein